MRIVIASFVLAAAASPAAAATVVVSEPSVLGLLAVGVVAGIAAVRLRRRK